MEKDQGRDFTHRYNMKDLEIRFEKERKRYFNPDLKIYSD